MRQVLPFLFVLLVLGCNDSSGDRIKIFDVHLHGDKSPESQLAKLKAQGVHTIAVSTSWAEQQAYPGSGHVKVLSGLFVPCPGGKVPYSLQTCFEDGKEWPDIIWVEQQVKEGKIQFIGEVLTQYHGISSSDSLMYPYYALAQKYGLPVGIHTGSAGPDHGCPDFKEEMGNPSLLKQALSRFPTMKAWLMHGGAPYVKECMEMMKAYPNLHADISVLNNPKIVPPAGFYKMMKGFIDAGLEDRLLFGTDNADIEVCIAAVEQLDFLTAKQRQKIFYENANKFFNK